MSSENSHICPKCMWMCDVVTGTEFFKCRHCGLESHYVNGRLKPAPELKPVDVFDTPDKTAEDMLDYRMPNCQERLNDQFASFLGNSSLQAVCAKFVQSQEYMITVANVPSKSTSVNMLNFLKQMEARGVLITEAVKGIDENYPPRGLNIKDTKFVHLMVDFDDHRMRIGAFVSGMSLSDMIRIYTYLRAIADALDAHGGRK